MGSYSHLPADLEISERSRKFYDGTYKWDSEGFTDSDGEYHRFDCLNPATQAPTPLPPMSLGDCEGENTGGGFAALEATTKHTPPRNEAIASGGFGEPGHKGSEYLLTDENPLKSRYEEKDQSPIGSAFLSNHGFHIGSSGLQDTGLSGNGKAAERKAKQPKTSGLAQDILNKQEGEKRAKELDPNISRYPSDLSDCPSDLSDWDIGDKASNTFFTPTANFGNLYYAY
ncbi:hypothetical protein IQ07DRAFT_282860 [Pyrenochaeta sp. DS3sAY3a]|nr:hypothetical protein IQ07DRAFT_282860 [Pyrenochaeta sp. DS3sAY3a]